MKKTILLALALVLGMAGARAQKLFKLTGDSISQPSYIVATHALLNPQGLVQKVDGMKDALMNTDQMCFYVDKVTYADVIKNAQKLPAGQTLKALLTPAQNQLLDKFLKKYTEVSWNSPYNQRRYNDKTPEAVEEELTKLLFVANHMSEFDPTHTFDEYFKAQADVNKEEVLALVGIDDYCKRYTAVPLKEQAAALAKFLENEQAELAKIDKTVAEFEAGNVDGVTQAMGVDTDEAAHAAKMVELARGKATLFVIPAEFLGGESGIVASLRAAGVTVE